MYEIIIPLYIFAAGLIFGSFFNVCIYRIPKGESVVNPPSHCGKCNTRLKALDLIPVFSYLFLRGRCRYCGEKFSPRYAVVELLTGILFLAVYIKYGLTFEFVKFVVFASFLVVIGMIDLDTTDVYSVTTYSGIAAGVVFMLAGLYFGQDIKEYIFGAFLGGGLITVIILLTKGMGWGDVEICALCGVFLGLKLTVVMLFFSFVFGGIIGVVLIVTKRKSRKDYIPFGPYIALGAIAAMLFGHQIIRWYLNGLFM